MKSNSIRVLQGVFTGSLLILSCSVTVAQDNAELAKQLANPVASLISVPFQLNYDQDYGPLDEGERYTLNIQPVVPISLSDDWNLISRTIAPVIWQDDVIPGESQSGLGDVVQSAFFSPKAPTDSGWIWGVGPVALLPTATEDVLGLDQWGLGPTAVALKQAGHWTLGVLGNHIWSLEDDENKPNVNATFIQPFLSYTTPNAVSITLNSESTYDWESEQWSVPVHLVATKVVSLGSQLVSVGGGLRYWADGPDNGPEGLGFRLLAIFLFPK